MSKYGNDICPVCGANKFNPNEIVDSTTTVRCPRCLDQFTGYPDGDKIWLICDDCGLKLGYIRLITETEHE